MDDDPIPLMGVNTGDFDRFLSILYPDDFRMRRVSTADEWGSVLELAAMWKFESIMHLAIDHLTQIDAPIDKIVLGRRHGVVEWLKDSYEAVCTRQTPLTHEEGNRLGMEEVIKISAVRQTYGLGSPRYDSRQLGRDLPTLFGFDKMLPPAPAVVMNEEVQSPGDHVVPEHVDEPKYATEPRYTTSALSIGTNDPTPTGSPDVKASARSLSKIKKKKIDPRKSEEQRNIEEEYRELAQRDMHIRDEPEVPEERGEERHNKFFSPSMFKRVKFGTP